MDELLEKICSLEQWLANEGKRVVNWPLALLAFLVLFVVLLLSNFWALGKLILGGIAGKPQVNSTLVDLVDDEKLESTLTGTEYVLLDFWAAWCGPCVMMKPAIDAISKRYGSQLTVVMVDAGTHSKIAQNYSVAGLPTLLFFHNGKLIGRHSGALSESHLIQEVETRFTDLRPIAKS